MTNKKNKRIDTDDPYLVFSTLQSNIASPTDEDITEVTWPPNKQKLRLNVEKNHRGGKTVVVVKGFVGSDSALQELAKVLKQFCGVGGSAKDGEIIIQGDQKEKIIKKLIDLGYKDSK